MTLDLTVQPVYLKIKNIGVDYIENREHETVKQVKSWVFYGTFHLHTVLPV